MKRIMLSIGHRCTANGLFKLINNDILQPSFFDGCYGDLKAHSYLINTIMNGKIDEIDFGIINCKNIGLIPFFYKIFKYIIKSKFFKKFNFYKNNKKRGALFFLLLKKLKFLIRQPIVFDESYFKNSEENKNICKIDHLYWLGKEWTIPGLKYGYLKKFTQKLSLWSDRELLTTQNSHFFFTHCEALNKEKRKLYLDKKDHFILNQIKTFPTDYFYLSRPSYLDNYLIKIDYLIEEVEKWRSYLNKRGDCRIFIILPIFMKKNLNANLPFIKKFSQDAFISFLKIELNSNQYSPTELYDIDFKDKSFQSQTASHMLKLRRIYNSQEYL